MSVLSPYSDWCVPRRRFFSAVPRLSAVSKINHSDWLFSLATQCMRSQNGREVRKQTIKKAHTDGYYFSFSNMFLIISRHMKQSVKQSVMDESENGTHTLFVVCIYHAVCLPVVASFE